MRVDAIVWAQALCFCCRTVHPAAAAIVDPATAWFMTNNIDQEEGHDVRSRIHTFGTCAPTAS